MARVYDNWERLVRSALRSEQRAGHERTPSGIAGSVPDSLQRTTNINAILQAADEIQSEDPNVARILCEQAYSMAQNLDPNSDGRGVLQFKTGLMSVIKQKLAKKDGGQIDRNRDIERLWEFYNQYKNRHKLDDIQREEQKWRETGTFSANLGDLQYRFSEMKRVFATLRALIEVMEALSKDAAQDGVGRLIKEELRRIKKSNATMSGELVPYNIVPLEAPSLTNAIGYFPEVRGAISAIRYTEQFPRLPADFEISGQRSLDMFDLLEYVFGFQKLSSLSALCHFRSISCFMDKREVFEWKLASSLSVCNIVQKDNIRNQREHVVLTLANAQSRLGIPVEADPKLDERAVREVFLKVLDNYIKWCRYLRIRVVWNSLEAINKERKLFLVSLYFCIWGEAANVRFLPECICYIFHHMARELDGILDHGVATPVANYINENGSVSFLEQIISPIYETLAAEAIRNNSGKAAHSEWRNYDDFNEYFWSPACFELSWPMKKDSPFLLKPKPKRGKRTAKSSFVEHRTFLHLYRSFHRLWIFLIVMFQALAIIAFHDGNLNLNTFKTLLSIGPTFAVMNFLESCLDVVLMFGAYTTARGMAISRLVIRFFWCALSSVFVLYVYLKLEEERNRSISDSFYFRIYVLVLGVYAGVRVLFALLLKFPSCHRLSEMSDQSFFQFFKWIYEERYFVGRGLVEKTTDYMSYVFFWLLRVFLAGDLCLQIPLCILSTGKPFYKSRWNLDNNNALTVASLWAPVVAIRSIEMVHKRFESFPEAFVKNLVSPQIKRMPFDRQLSQYTSSPIFACEGSALPMIITRPTQPYFPHFGMKLSKVCGKKIISVTGKEMDLLSMPSNTGSLKLVQWPLFLLSSKILLAVDLALDCKDTQSDLWSRICKDEYMAYAVQECYSSIEKILHSLVDGEGRLWVERIFREINSSISEGSLVITLSLKKLPVVLSRFTALTGLLIRDPTPELAKGAAKAVYDFYDVVTHELLSRDLSVFTPYYSETVLYSNSELRVENEDGISTLFYLQKIFPDEWENFLERIGEGDSGDAELQESSTSALELRFWASYRGQTLARTVRGMMYYRKALMLQSHLEGRFVEENVTPTSLSTQGFELSREARAQADIKFTYVVSCQIYGQQKQRKAPEAADIALLLQRNEALRVAFIHVEESGEADGKVTKEFYSKLVKADAHGKDQEIFSIKLPGDPKLGEGKPENQNHAIIFTRGDAVQTIDMNQPPWWARREHVSEVMPRALARTSLSHNVFGFGAVPCETVDSAGFLQAKISQIESLSSHLVCQDNYLEEAMKMRNLLEEFRANHGLRPPTILGVREHVFTGSVSSLAWFMSNQETSFVTLGQRVLAKPLKVRMHYGHPDVFDRIFHVTRGGISKASRVINISEDIYAGFNSTLRQGNITHHEYIQVGKGRDVGLNQIALFEGKVAGGNGEQVLSRDVYRIGQLFDFFRMLSFFFTTVGYYVCTMMTVLTVYVFLYGRAYLAFSGLDQGISREARFLGNTALDAVLNAQFLVQIGIFTAVPMIMGFILELGLLQAVFSFITMQLQLCSVFFTFSLGTRTHYFGRTILHGGAKYRATGRGFVVRHIKFAENYRLYSRSHFVKALEVALLLIVYMAYGYSEGGAVSFVLLTLSSWFLVISWLFAPYIFNPSGFEWQKTVEDFDDWTNWLMYKGGVGVKGDNSWESWWDEEQMHIQTLRGRILETILSLRFIMFQYGIVYKLHLTGDDTSIAVYGFSWVVLVGIVLIFKIFTFSPKKSTNFQLMLRFMQGVTSIGLIVALCLVVLFTSLSIADLFASILAFIPTGWFILSLAITWKKVVRSLGVWDSVKEFARMYDAGMGILIFAPIAVLSWFPFVSTFQSRLLFNQAFSRGLEISLILAGNKANVEASSF
ncbi:3 glucan synthase [Striga asiatica]|uniref:1,3-beta-glucan synthase n=1 Tax=Striga asiatica TaxID=4170 RepID=A0A5A7NYB5_STRAF|nr:3 glucan synthase [Striga asiatica]